MQSGAWFGSRAYYTSTATPARTEGLALSEVHRREGVGTLRIALCDKTASFFEFSLCLSRACLGKMFVFIYKWRKKTVLSPSAALSNHTKPSWLQRNACNATPTAVSQQPACRRVLAGGASTTSIPFSLLFPFQRPRWSRTQDRRKGKEGGRAAGLRTPIRSGPPTPCVSMKPVLYIACRSPREAAFSNQPVQIQSPHTTQRLITLYKMSSHSTVLALTHCIT
jgi:hypothetical protein